MSERERRRVEQLRAEERAVQAAAVRVRDAVDGNLAALSLPHVAAGCGELLDVQADGLAGLPDPGAGAHRAGLAGADRGPD